MIDGAHALGQIDPEHHRHGPHVLHGQRPQMALRAEGCGLPLHSAQEHEPDLEPLVVSHGWSGEPRALPPTLLVDQHHRPVGIPGRAPRPFTVPDSAPTRPACAPSALNGPSIPATVSAARSACLPFAPTTPTAATAGSSRCSPHGCRKSTGPSCATDSGPSTRSKVPIPGYPDDRLIRVSIQAYNTSEDVDRLIIALEASLRTVADVYTDRRMP